jgi:tetratricopeptide (TPR) repeat protein
VARADRRRAAREARHVQRRPRAAAGGARIAEDTMFFPKLRAHAKWVFVLLVVVFAGGFVFLGVGSGSTGLGDLLNGNISLFGGGGSSSQVGKDRNRIKKNPKDFAAYKDLATALQAANKDDEAIAVLEGYRKLKPKDTEALTQLAGLYLRKADLARSQAQDIQTQSQEAFAGQVFAPDPNSKIGQALQGTADPLGGGADPINRAVQSHINIQSGTAYTDMTSAYKQAVSVYRQIATENPNDPSVQFQLAQAADAGSDTKTAIAAYKRFLKLAPDDPTAPAIKQRLKQLTAAQVRPAVGAGG